MPLAESPVALAEVQVSLLAVLSEVRVGEERSGENETHAGHGSHPPGPKEAEELVEPHPKSRRHHRNREPGWPEEESGQQHGYGHEGRPHPPGEVGAKARGAEAARREPVRRW